VLCSCGERQRGGYPITYGVTDCVRCVQNRARSVLVAAVSPLQKHRDARGGRTKAVQKKRNGIVQHASLSFVFF
jgi:hypothetical protein